MPNLKGTFENDIDDINNKIREIEGKLKPENKLLEKTILQVSAENKLMFEEINSLKKKNP